MICVDLEILQVSRLLYIEGKKALRSRLQETGMYYSHDSPPKQLDKDEVDTANDEDDNAYVKECNAHIRFLKQYGDCFETLYIHWCPEGYDLEFSLHWFPNLKEVGFNDHRYEIKATKDDGYLQDGELNEEAVLRKFKQLSEDNEDEHGDPIFDEDVIQELRSRKGIDRSYTVKFDLNLEVENVGQWVIDSIFCMRWGPTNPIIETHHNRQ
jgi:hypothetical protein